MRQFPPVHPAALLLLLSAPLPAQADRYELGRRLREFEIAFDQHADTGARKRALPHLQRAVSAFFTLNLAAAGRSLSEATHALRSAARLDAAQTWAASLVLKPTRPLLDTGAEAMQLELGQLWDPECEAPPRARLVLEVREAGTNDVAAWTELAIPALPARIDLPLLRGKNRAGEHQLEAKVFLGDEILARSRAAISFVDRLAARLEVLHDFVRDLPDTDPTTESETLRGWTRLLESLAKGRAQETDHRAAELLARAEALRAACAQGERYFVTEHRGDQWLRLRIGPRTHTVRLLVPEELTAPAAPLVFALHGTGGSENMFFDAYGHGAIVRACAERGWVLVSPRQGLGGSTPDAWVDALAARYPIDRARVYFVGHSLGAMQAARAAGQCTGLAGLALLGGAANVPLDAERLATLPIYLGVGSADQLALAGVRGVERRLRELGAARLSSRVFPDIEHLAIVQVALPEVFALFAGPR